MGAKHPYTWEGEIDDARNPPEITQRWPAKRSRPNAVKPHSTTSGAAAINPIKAKIRDVTRLLDRSNNLPAGVRIEKERALAGYRQDLELAEAEKRKQQMISKYHMVRFFERQKAMRNLKKLKARITDTDQYSAEYEGLQKAAHEAEVDVNYALYHPLDEKYQSIYPRNGNNDAITKGGANNRGVWEVGAARPAMWKLVETCMTDGTLLALRNGQLRKDLTHANSQQSLSAAAGHHERAETIKKRSSKGVLPKKTTPQEHDGDSDGGFFEE